MGKRKSRKTKAPPPKKAKLEKAFDCPFCNSRASVECTINLKDRIATARCEVCKDVYFTSAHALTEPIDVYSDWIDACELANEGVVRGDDF
ncbi:hypothetical protein SETIT_4G068300v2 [Setaria italica]|uniref:Transcription elongation factor 1 homolog n=3 Tax=Setaria TaxID=4554 RepID=A0A368QRT5_SETIT|nr:transcription elongation factor 1 homolog [Setaria italica]XP_034591631.1 transcription elongation factor 1 homolog [Setaria viridis]RCV20583.1 hypothetical protein SETIT_4G068300v2 [Setaria italica]TKW20143.1 hypothetical protein SEVIR_4G066300v2 [Setaria viridis]